MDKVIIDGVDVSGCESYTHNHNELMPYGDVKVTEHYCWHINSNCDGKECEYKQLKRLQQENEELKADIESRTMCITCERELQNCNLQAESERLKEENKQLKKLKFKSDGIELLQDANLNLHNANVKYRQALQEIREIANKAYYTEDYMLGERFTELVDAINLTITNIIGAEE